jgi:hypothetical protein
VENGSLRILEAQILADLPQWNSGCAKRCLRRLEIRNPQRHVVWLAQRLIARTENFKRSSRSAAAVGILRVHGRA